MYKDDIRKLREYGTSEYNVILLRMLKSKYDEIGESFDTETNTDEILRIQGMRLVLRDLIRDIEGGRAKIVSTDTLWPGK